MEWCRLHPIHPHHHNYFITHLKTKVRVNALSKNYAASMNRSEGGCKGGRLLVQKIWSERLLWVCHSILSKAAVWHRNKPIFLGGTRITLNTGWQFLKDNSFVTSHPPLVCTHFISFPERGRGKRGGWTEGEKQGCREDHLPIQGFCWCFQVRAQELGKSTTSPALFSLHKFWIFQSVPGSST